MLVPFKLLLREIADRSLRDAEFPRDLRLGQPVVKQAQKLLPPFDHRPFPLPLLHRCHVRALELLHAIADRALRDVELPRYLRLRQPVVKQALNLLPPFDHRPLPLLPCHVRALELLHAIGDRALRDVELPRYLRLRQPVVKQAQKLLPPFDHPLPRPRPLPLSLPPRLLPLLPPFDHLPLPLLLPCHVRALELLHAIADRALMDVELPRYLRLRQPVVKQALNLLPPFDLPLPRPLPRPLSLPPRPHAHVLARPREGAFLDYALVLNVCDGVAMLLDGHQARHRHPKDSRLFREGDGEVHADAQRRAPGQDPMERGELLAEDAAARSAHDVDAGGPHPECLALSLHDRVHVAFGRMDV